MQVAPFIARRIAFADRRSLSYIIVRIATASVALSVAIMLIATGLVAGFKREISAKIFGFWGHIHISDAGTTRSFEALPISTHLPFSHTFAQWRDSAFVRWAAANGYPPAQPIRHLQAFAIKPGIIKTKTTLEGIILKGVGNDFDWGFLKKYIIAGDTLSTDTTLQQILISATTAQRLQVQVGNKFIIYFEQEGDLQPVRFIIKGIYKTGLEEYDKRLAITNLPLIQQLLRWQPDQVNGFEVYLTDLHDMAAANEYIYQEILPDNLYCETIQEKNPNIFEWLNLQDINEVVILTLMLIVCIINMTTSMLILILERTNMIGILKALGSTNWTIRRIFLFKAGYIVGIGLLWGNLIGLGLLALQYYFRFIQLPEADYYLSYAPVHFDWVTIGLINIGTLLTILCFLLIPSYVVTRIAPVKAIRFN